jgi:hypothetical protein
MVGLIYTCFGWKFVHNFGNENSSEKFSAEMEFCRIDPREPITRPGDAGQTRSEPSGSLMVGTGLSGCPETRFQRMFENSRVQK